METGSIIHDLSWLLLGAGIAAVVFHWLKQPTILGYLLIGFLLGPHFPLFPTVKNIENIHALSNLGVIFLMFYLGLEFNISKLKKVFVPSLFALVLQTILLFFIGFKTASYFGWPHTQSFFLGGILTISSSMVTVSLLRKRNAMNRPYAHLTLGISVLEDILAVLLLILLTSIAVDDHIAWEEIIHALYLVGIFVVAVFVIGKLFAPRILFFLKKIGDPEIITLFTVGLILGVSILSQHFKFSLALGAFLAGGILSRSALADEIERLTEPLRDVFNALFFVSMGMFIIPSDLANTWKTILILSLLVMAGKFISCWIGFVLAGQKPSTSTRASMAKIQIGEFGFIIAAMGTSLHVIDSRLGAVVSGVAFCTIFATPIINAHTEKFIRFCDKKCPHPLQDFFALYHNWFEIIRLGLLRSIFVRTTYRLILRITVNFLLTNAIIILAALILSKFSLPPEWEPWQNWTHGIFFIIPILICIPFLVDTLRNIDVLALFVSESALGHTSLRPTVRNIVRDAFTVVLRAFLFFIFLTVFFAAASPYLPSGMTLVFLGTIAIILGITLWKKVVRIYSRMEGAVLESMLDQSRAALTETISDALSRITQSNPWAATIEEIEISKNSKFVGMKISELNLRNHTGATIIAVRRSEICLYDSLSEIPIFPQDRLLIFGEKEQIDAAAQYLNQPGESTKTQPPDYSLQKILIPRDSDMIGLSLKDLNLSQNYGLTILGIQRKNIKITGPKAEETIHPEDILFVMGTPTAIEQFSKQKII